MFLDQYGTVVPNPTDFGPSTADAGLLFGEIEGFTVNRSSDGNRLGKFTLSCNGFVLSTRASYWAALDACASYGLTAVDCTR